MSQLGDDVVVRSVEGLLEGRRGAHPRCLNCDTQLHGEYCSACGQKAASIEVGLGEFVREAVDNLFSFDSRMWRTLRLLLFRPGHLTTEYWAGRRARYVSPLRLYLFVSFVAFLVLGAVGDRQVIQTSESQQRGTGDRPIVQVQATNAAEIDWEEDLKDAPTPVRWLVLRIVRPLIENQELGELLFQQRLPWAIFLMVPVFAALLKLTFRRTRRYFVAHLVFSLHLHAAVYLLVTAGGFGDWALSTDLLSALSSLVALVLFVVALRRVYENGWVLTLVKAAVLLFIHLIALAIVLLATVAITALTL